MGRLGSDPFSKSYYQMTDDLTVNSSPKSPEERKFRNNESNSPKMINSNRSSLDFQSRNEANGLFSGVTKLKIDYSTL